MVGERQQHNGDAHDDLDFSMASDGSHLIWHNHGDEMDDLLEADPNMSNNDDADAAATDDNGGATESNQRTASRRAKRHRREQIQQLETVFRECPHPDEKLRQELSKRVGMDALQVKFWFQNRRSSMKNQIEKQESKVIRGENEVLRAENQAIRAAILKKICPTCGGPTVPIVETPEQRRLRVENARLKDEILRASAVLNMFSGKAPAAPIPTPAGGRYDLAIDLNIVDPHVGAVMHDPVVLLPPRGALVDPMLLAAESCARGHCAVAQGDGDRAALLRHVRRASEEFMMLAQKGEPMWLPTPDGEVLNLQEYTNATFPSMFGLCPVGFAVDATRDIGMVMGNAADLVDILSDARRWSDMFPGIVAGVTASDIVTTGLSRHGLTQLMNAELRVLSPRVPVRKVKFVRHVKMLEPSLWAVVDVSVDGILGQDGGSMADLHARNDGVTANYTACRLLPSGCLIQDINNGYCKVTWIINVEYDETNVPPLFHPLLRSGQALGACRWLASLQRQSEYLAVLRSDLVPSLSSTGFIPPEKRNGVLKMAQRMMASFYAAMCGPAGHVCGVDDWRGRCGVGAERFEVVVRVATSRAGGSVPGAGEQNGYLVVSGTTTVWLPGTPAQRVFDYLCDGDRRGEWDALANGAPVQEECYVATGQFHGNAVSVLRPSAFDGTDSNKLILQEVCTDASCMLVAYAAIDEQSMKEVLNGSGHATFFLPSGFVILPDGHSEPRVPPVAAERSSSAPVSNRNIAGSLVSAMYQTVLSGPTPENLAAETIDNVGNLLCHAIKNIKDVINANIIVTA